MLKPNQFKINLGLDLGFPNLFNNSPRKTKRTTRPIKAAITKYAIYTQDFGGTQIRHTFNSETKARAFYQLARQSSQYQYVSRPRLDL